MRRGPNRQIFGEGWPRRYELPSSPNYSKLEFCRFVQYQWVTSKFAKNLISRAVSGARIALNETISRIPIFRKKISPMPSLEYPVVVEPLSGEEGGGFAAIAPDLPGCMSDGDTPEEALAQCARRHCGLDRGGARFRPADPKALAPFRARLRLTPLSPSPPPAHCRSHSPGSPPLVC
jgi:hypothetical protein